MRLTTPKTIEHILVERQLEPAIDESARGGQNQGGKLTPSETLRNMPVVSIGQPETWPLQKLYSPKKLPGFVQTKLGGADFYLARFSCSFRPLHEESRVEWARFCVNLLPHPVTKAQPSAFDLYPL